MIISYKHAVLGATTNAQVVYKPSPPTPNPRGESPDAVQRPCSEDPTILFLGSNRDRRVGNLQSTKAPVSGHWSEGLGRIHCKKDIY